MPFALHIINERNHLQQHQLETIITMPGQGEYNDNSFYGCGQCGGYGYREN